MFVSIEYYRVIKEMIDYYGFTKHVLFKCDWFDANNHNNEIKVDEYDFTLINTNRFLASTEQYILASQVSQVFYVEDL